MNASEVILLAAAVVFLFAAVVSRRRARNRTIDRGQVHWDQCRPAYLAALPGSTEVSGRWRLSGRDELETAVQTSYAHPDGRQCVLQFVAGPEHGGTDLLGIALPDRGFPLVIQLTSGGHDEFSFTTTGHWDDADAIPLIAELAALGVHNLDAEPHMNVSVSGPKQLVERLPRILDVLARIEALQPRA